MQKFARVVEHVGTEKFNDLQALEVHIIKLGILTN